MVGASQSKERHHSDSLRFCFPSTTVDLEKPTTGETPRGAGETKGLVKACSLQTKGQEKGV